MSIRLSDHFHYRRLLRFTAPSVVMMIFTSLYGVVDGLFVSNFVGKTPFAAINFIFPFLMLLGPIGFLFGAGGSAVIASLFGEGKQKEARGIFSMLVYLTLFLGVFVSACGITLLPTIASLLGAEGELLENSIVYGRIILCALPLQMIQFEFETFFITAEKPKLGLLSTVLAGVTNMALDALFILGFSWGLEGAALATAASQFVGGLFPLIYFSRKNKSLLRLGRPLWRLRAIVKTVTNGISELVTHISLSLVGILYNAQLLHFAGENGIAAYGVLMYVNFIFISAFIGYSTGVAPVVSYHVGAKNPRELKSLFKKSLVILTVCAAAMFLLSEALAVPLSALFVAYDAELFSLTVHAFRIFSFTYLFAEIGIFASAFFTALGDGTTSAALSFLRTLVLQVAAILILPALFGTDGIWVADVAANGLSVFFALGFFYLRRRRFGYGT